MTDFNKASDIIKKAISYSQPMPENTEVWFEGNVHLQNLIAFALKAERERILSTLSAHDKSFLRVSLERDEALAKLNEVVPVLEWYASENSWHDGDSTTPAEHDSGYRARALLEKLTPEPRSVE